ncbi:apolipoprotein N-acyltransferase [Blochmannia endosymbiont of Camponotus (Colobopsis) obliquus]|uniref:apolipoprotein N-acyltransferase n=1 Tax=Blochmannia endosymbiont of Camponotus (Colobopsis) obliquus TaxID=1505597 RepID=UPI002A4E2A98|nr:apolipoprotein N-acyltransferase [Blochmannia endosymbiont of Camponotus (Colobopsis) obliquus]
MITGIVGVFAFSPYNFWPLSILSLTGLLITTLQCNIKQAALQGFIWGIGLFGTGVHWIYISMTTFGEISTLTSILITSIFIIYLTFYPTLFSILLVKIWPNSNLWRLTLGASVLWSVIEFLRGWILTGFPWLQFGYSQINGPLKGLAPIFGVKFITFIIVIISGLLTFFLTQKHYPSLLTIIILLLFITPLNQIRWYYIQPQRAVNITLIQGNIDQNIKWNNEKINEILNVYLQKTLPIINKTQIIIWPETAIPDLEINQTKLLLTLDKQLRQNNTSLITGIIGVNEKSYKYTYYNSIIVLGDSIPYCYNYTKNRYNKHHLVPFGEINPSSMILQHVTSFLNLPINFLQKGHYLQPQLQAANMKFTAAICYEIIIDEQIQKNFCKDTDFLLIISNDAWFGNSIGPWQHFQMACMRALELGRPLLSCTNNGITAIVSADGISQKQLPTSTCQTLNMNIFPTKGTTPYAKMGYYPLWILIFICGIIAFIFGRNINN